MQIGTVSGGCASQVYAWQVWIEQHTGAPIVVRGVGALDVALSVYVRAGRALTHLTLPATTGTTPCACGTGCVCVCVCVCVYMHVSKLKSWTLITALWILQQSNIAGDRGVPFWCASWRNRLRGPANSMINKMGFELLYADSRRVLPPKVLGSHSKTHLESRCCIILM